MLARPVGIKLFPTAKTLGCDDRSIVLQRFEREVRAAAPLQSPNTVKAFDYAVSDTGKFDIVMELLKGVGRYIRVVKNGPILPPPASCFLRQVCRLLIAAHAAGMVYCDIKPRNLFAGWLGAWFDFVKVLDFGIVKLREEDVGEDSDTGQLFVGSPQVAAPQMIGEFERSDPRCNIYAMACVAFFLLTG
jgi:serine/threonine protein kinase